MSKGSRKNTYSIQSKSCVSRELLKFAIKMAFYLENVLLHEYLLVRQLISMDLLKERFDVLLIRDSIAIEKAE